MRCPDCNKFAAYDTEQEPEVNSEEFDGERFTAEVTRTLTCESCSTELKSYTFEIEVDAKIEEPEEDEKKPDAMMEDDELEDVEEHVHEWEVTAEAQPLMRTITKDRHGRPIKRARYMKTEYGVEVEFSAECECGAKAAASAEDYVQASSMDELV